MNVPNAITLSRLLITAGTFVCLESIADPAHPDSAIVWGALGLFLVAAFTDFIDGYLARKWNLVTAFGRVADPFADKVLTTWYVVVVIAREFLVTAIRGLVESTGRPFPADRLGKWKMVAQCWTIGALLTLVAGSQLLHWAAVGGYWVSFALTVVSGINYVWKARDILFAK